MQAIKIRSTIPESRQVTLPLEVPPGDAEIIVLYATTPRRSEALLEFLDRLESQPRVGREKEAIDRDLQSDRESWE